MYNTHLACGEFTIAFKNGFDVLSQANRLRGKPAKKFVWALDVPTTSIPRESKRKRKAEHTH